MRGWLLIPNPLAHLRKLSPLLFFSPAPLRIGRKGKWMRANSLYANRSRLLAKRFLDFRLRLLALNASPQNV